MNKSSVLVLLTGLFYLLSCQSSEKPETTTEEEKSSVEDTQQDHKTAERNYEEEGKKYVQHAGKTLQHNLQNAMGEGGLEKALSFCSVHAIDITDSVADMHDVQIQRLATKNRNPENLAEKVDAEMVAYFEENPEEIAKIKQQEDKKVYYHAIRIDNPLCLNCHGTVGEELSKENYAKIQQYYPEDKAVGFEMGELRGIWKLSFPAEEG